MPAKKKSARKKVKKAFKSKADKKYLVENYFGGNARELEPKGNYWNPEKAGDIMEGELTRTFTDNNGVERFCVTPEGAGEELILPSHTLLLNLLRNIEIGEFVQILCIYVGSGRGDPYEYRAAVIE